MLAYAAASSRNSRLGVWRCSPGAPHATRTAQAGPATGSGGRAQRADDGVLWRHRREPTEDVQPALVAETDLVVDPLLSDLRMSTRAPLQGLCGPMPAAALARVTRQVARFDRAAFSAICPHKPVTPVRCHGRCARWLLERSSLADAERGLSGPLAGPFRDAGTAGAFPAPSPPVRRSLSQSGAPSAPAASPRHGAGDVCRPPRASSRQIGQAPGPVEKTDTNNIMILKAPRVALPKPVQVTGQLGARTARSSRPGPPRHSRSGDEASRAGVRTLGGAGVDASLKAAACRATAESRSFAAR